MMNKSDILIKNSVNMSVFEVLFTDQLGCKFGGFGLSILPGHTLENAF